MIIFVTWVLAAFITKRTSRRQSAAASITYRIMAIAAYLLLFNSHAHAGFLGIRFRPASALADSLGFVITIAGIGLCLWARFFLGRNWSSAVTVKKDHELIQTGPYALVRHPIYAGFSLATLGTALTLGEVRGLISVVLLVLAWRMKWGAEEAFMSQEFGEQYTEYRRNVHAIIPGIW
jgi:protein-S-isoprenylcysteine O-methyltransferase Ste14